MHTHTHTSRKHANAYAWTCACVWLCNNLTDSWRCCGLQLQLLQQQQQELQEHAACWQLPDTRQLVYLPHTWTAHVHTTQPPTVLVSQVRIRARQPTASSRWPGLAKRRGQQASAEQLNNNAWVIMQLTAKSINDVNYMPTTGQPNSHTHTHTQRHSQTYNKRTQCWFLLFVRHTTTIATETNTHIELNSELVERFTLFLTFSIFYDKTRKLVQVFMHFFCIVYTKLWNFWFNFCKFFEKVLSSKIFKKWPLASDNGLSRM